MLRCVVNMINKMRIFLFWGCFFLICKIALCDSNGNPTNEDQSKGESLPSNVIDIMKKYYPEQNEFSRAKNFLKAAFNELKPGSEPVTEPNPVDSSLDFSTFLCIANFMKVDYEMLYPQFGVFNHSKNFKKRLSIPTLPNDLKRSQDIFLRFEKYYKIQTQDQASSKLKIFFKSMYAWLTRCEMDGYKDMILPQNLEICHVFRKRLLNGKTDEAEQKAEIIKFAASYARIRHGLDGLHNFYGFRVYYQILKINYLQPSDYDFIKQLHNLRFLDAWHFDNEDCKYANMIRKVVHPAVTEEVKAIPYTVVIDENMKRVGFIPFIDPKKCPKTKLVRKI